ncbi:MAG: hypothetical protein WBA45_14285 [Microthrixaceae bacterium]
MIQIHALLGAVLANTDSSSGSWSLIGLIFFLSGFVFYGYVFFRYRNADKRFKHEERTHSIKTDLKTSDDLSRSLKDLRNANMHGANSHAVRGSQNGIAGLLGAAGQGSAKGIMDEVMRLRPDK